MTRKPSGVSESGVPRKPRKLSEPLTARNPWRESEPRELNENLNKKASQ